MQRAALRKNLCGNLSNHRNASAGGLLGHLNTARKPPFYILHMRNDADQAMAVLRRIHQFAHRQFQKAAAQRTKSLVHKHGIQPNGGSGAGLNRIRHAQRQRERGQKTFAAGKRSDVADASVVMIHHILIKPHLALCAVSALAGIGAGIAGCRIGLALCRFSGGQLVLSLGLASIVAPICNYLVLLCPEPYWVIPALLFPALFALLPSVYPTASGEEGEHTYPFSRIPLFLWCGCLLTAFSESAYYNLYGALEPVMPGPSLSVLVLVVLGGLSALLVLGQAHRSPIWYAFLLVIPVLVVGYTAWPLLHRESPGLSLGGLLFGYTLLNIYMMTAFLHTVSYRKGTRRLQLLACGIGGIALASWMGSHNSGWITESIARGDSLNSLFAFQAFAILAGSFIFVVYLEKVGFFRLAKGEAAAPERVAGQAPSTPMSLMDWPIEELETHFRELGLTRQQAMIAALLARKTPDTTICDNLNISPSTLKTHIRNIHRRLGISSRHELAWLVTANPAGISETQGGGR